MIFAFARSIQGAIILGLSTIVIILSLYIWGFNVAFIGFDGLRDKLEDCRVDQQKLKDLAEQSKRKIEETRRQIDKANARIIYVEREVGNLENRPVEGNCPTPDKTEWGAIL